MSACLVELDKLHGVRPVGVRETWRQLFSKCMLKVTVPEANHVCKDGNICAVLMAGIDGEVHRVQSIWDANYAK